ncbi:hypothetical protein TSH100_17125 [Azospirillum sp. TSH100]|nr:hypothetical protein TSH100_17125 [Azospirillum sp. TSH100]
MQDLDKSFGGSGQFSRLGVEFLFLALQPFPGAFRCSPDFYGPFEEIHSTEHQIRTCHDPTSFASDGVAFASMLSRRS